MATPSYPQPADHGLDITHIRRVCEHVTEEAVAVLRGSGAVVVRAPDVEQAATAADALARVGYQVDRPRHIGRRDELTVTGWSRTGLASRITRLNAVARELERSRADTAATAIDLYDIHANEMTDPQDATVRRVREVMTGWAADRAGPLAGHPRPSGRTDDATARLLRAAHRAERHVGDVIDRALMAADGAVRRYADYRQFATPKAAREAAIHDTFPPPKPPTSLERHTRKEITAMPATNCTPTPTRFGVVTTVNDAEEAWAATMARMDVCYRLGVQPHPGDVADNTRLLDTLGATSDESRQALFERLSPRIAGKTNRIIDALSELATKPDSPSQARRLNTSPAALAAADFPEPVPGQSPAPNAQDPGPARNGQPGGPRRRGPGR